MFMTMAVRSGGENLMLETNWATHDFTVKMLDWSARAAQN
jgi:hypothetical protein